MAWEESIIIAIMVCAFLFFYLTTILKGEGTLHTPLRIFFLILGLFFMIYGLSFAIKTVQADYEGGTSVMTEENYGNITAMTTGAFQVMNWTVYIVLAWIVVAFLVFLIMAGKDSATGKYSKDGIGMPGGKKKWRWN